jgi:hypothetical protein
MRFRVIAAAVTVLALVASPVAASGPTLEEGATFFDNNTCVEADGATGFAGGDGQCVTAADYDVLYGFENLSVQPDTTNPEQSIAETYGLVDDGVSASDRKLGVGLVDEPFTVNERLEELFGDYPDYAFEPGTWYIF